MFELAFPLCLSFSQREALLGRKLKGEIMKATGIKYLFIIALAAVAVQACAKKDSSLRARQQQNIDEKKVADEKAKADEAAKKAGVDPGKAAGAGTDVVDKNKKVVVEELFDAAQVYDVKGCGEIPKLTAASVGEEELTVEDLLRGGKKIKLEVGKYQLSKLDLMSVKLSQKGEEKAVTTSFKAFGSQYLSAADMKEAVFANDKLTLNCHNRAKSPEPLNAETGFPNEIDLETGAFSILRKDEISIKDAGYSRKTTLSKHEGNIKNLDVPTEGLEVMFVAGEDNTFSIRKQLTLKQKVEAGITVSRKAYVSAVYELKK